jgi:hypothetical protein
MRETFPADVIRREVLAKRRRALVIYGLGHLQRKSPQANFESVGPAASLVSLLEDRSTTRVFNVSLALDVSKEHAVPTDVPKGTSHMKPSPAFYVFGPLSILCFLWVSCDEKSPVAPEPTPEWLTALIRNFEMQPVANPPVSITRYEYKSEVVYLVSPRCCDNWSDLYRADGTTLCHPDGGLTGNGDGRCPDFLIERKNAQIIWQDPRGAR